MSLVENLGGFTLFEFLDRVTADEIALWKAYNHHRIEENQRKQVDQQAINNTPKGK